MNKKVGLSTLVNIKVLRIIIIILSMLSTHLYCILDAPPVCAKCPSTPTCQWPPSAPAWPPPSTQYRHRSGAQWSYPGMHANKLIKTINGNRRLGYNLSMWNCRRGLINTDKEPSTKMVEVTNFIQSRKLHMLCLVESDLHSAVSRYNRAQPLTTKSRTSWPSQATTSTYPLPGTSMNRQGSSCMPRRSCRSRDGQQEIM